MQVLKWSDVLETHIDVIDCQHRGLVDMVNATATRLAADSALGNKDVRLLLAYLKDYAEVHFSTEEALMALCGLAPDYTARHHQNHLRFLSHVGDMVDSVGQRGGLDGRQVLDFLGDWLVRHIQGEDQRLAQRLHAARQSVSRSSPVVGPSVDGALAEPGFAAALVRASAALHAGEADVPALLAESDRAALLFALDANLMPAQVMHANAACATLLGRSVEALQTCSAANLFGATEAGRFPVLMSEVLVSGQFEGRLSCVAPDGSTRALPTRITHLVVDGQMVILVLLGMERAVGLETEVGGEVEVPRAPRRPGRPAGVAPDHGERVAAALGGDSHGTVISRHALFRGLGADELARLEGASSLVPLAKGQVLFHKDDEPAGLYMVISGHVSLSVSNQRGAEKVFGIFGTPQVFGELEVFAGGPCLMTAQSLSPTVLLLIPVATLRELQRSSPVFASAAASYLGRQLQHSVGEIEALTLHTALERIIDHLLEHAAATDHGVLEAVLPAPKHVIASCLNLTPPTLSRAFQQLSEAGLITVSGRYVSIPDGEALLRYGLREAGG